MELYIHGYLNPIQSSRRLVCQRNVDLIWLAGRLAPDFKTIADFRRDNGTDIRNVYRRFVVVSRDLKLFIHVLVAIDGSKLKALNTRATRISPPARSTSAGSKSRKTFIATWWPSIKLTGRNCRSSRPKPAD